MGIPYNEIRRIRDLLRELEEGGGGDPVEIQALKDRLDAIEAGEVADDGALASLAGRVEELEGVASVTSVAGRLPNGAGNVALTHADLGAISIADLAFDPGTQSELDAAAQAISQQVASKANTADVYTKTQVDAAVAPKADASSVYTKTQVDSTLAHGVIDPDLDIAGVGQVPSRAADGGWEPSSLADKGVGSHSAQALGDQALGLVSRSPTGRGWVDLGVVPGASGAVGGSGGGAQTTQLGRRISDVIVFDGRVFAAYGDYIINTGPIQVAAYNLTTQTWAVEALLQTEQVWYRVIGTRLWAIYMDPRGNAGTPSLAYRDAGSTTWTTVSVSNPVTAGFPPAHLFDIVAFGGSLYLCGQRDTGLSNPHDGLPNGERYLACVWRSTDGGATWTEWRTEPLTPGSGSQGARYWMAGVLQGKLWVQAVESYGTYPWAPRPKAAAWDGATWADAPSMLPTAASDGRVQTSGWRARPFTGVRAAVGSTVTPAEVLVYGGGHAIDPTSIYIFDGRGRRQIRDDARAYCVQSDWLWVLGPTGDVTATNNCEQWSRNVMRGPSNAVSIWAEGAPGTSSQRIYVGTADSHVWMLSGVETEWMAPAPVDSTATASRLYGTTAGGAQTTYGVTTGAATTSVPLRDAAGRSKFVPGATAGEAVTVEQVDLRQSGQVAVPPGAFISTIGVTAGTARYTRFVPARDMTIRSLAFAVTTASAADDSIELAIYDAAMTRLVTSGAVAGLLNSLGVKRAPIANTTLTAGTVYYLAGLTPSLGGAAAAVCSVSMVSGFAANLFGAGGSGVAAPSAEIGTTGSLSSLPTTPAVSSASVGFLIAAREVA